MAFVSEFEKDRPSPDDYLAEALEAETAPSSVTTARNWWLLLGVVAVCAAVVIGFIVFWPSAEKPSPPASQNTASPGNSTEPPAGGPAIPGADLLTGTWPQQSAKAFNRDLKVTRVSRVLMTSNQIQATGAVPGADHIWSDLIYIEDKAIDAGSALIAPQPAELFDLKDVALGEVPRLVASAQAAASQPITDTLVMIARDAVSPGDPVHIQVFVTGAGKRSLLTASAAGVELKN